MPTLDPGNTNTNTTVLITVAQILVEITLTLSVFIIIINGAWTKVQRVDRDRAESETYIPAQKAQAHHARQQ
jgi:hypothetical protein